MLPTNSATQRHISARQNRVKEIDYPDTASESFTYNGFGQVLTHTMTSGGVENFRYDGRGLKYLLASRHPSDPNPEQHPTQYFYYTSGPSNRSALGMVDPRGALTSSSTTRAAR